MIDPYHTGILLAYGVFMIGMFTPGPNILAVIGTSMSVGRSEGKALALGVATGTFCWSMLTALGLTALVSTYASIMIFLKIVGAGYLLWLAFKALKSAMTVKELDVRPVRLDGGPVAFYRRGLLIQMTNAKAALVWIAIMSLAMDGQAPIWVAALVVVGTSIISAVGHVIYAVAFSTSPVVAAYAKARRWIEGVLGVYFCFASYKLATYRA
ncbi:LysE family translocator [Phaeobacter sp. JH20_14]|uniref:LysE family translocator n=1 Tax=Phaeobacter sp. JH20_14 TaxID=3112473 RepID=UPI003A8B137B